MAHGESQMESRLWKESQKPSITKPKYILKIGYLNVRTMCQVGKTANIRREFGRYDLNIMGINEWDEPILLSEEQLLEKLFSTVHLYEEEEGSRRRAQQGKADQVC